MDIFDDKTKVNTISVSEDKGYNEAVFDLSFSKRGKKDFEKLNKDTKIKPARNGIHYLPKGQYTVKIGEEIKNFTLKWVQIFNCLKEHPKFSK